MKYLNGKGFLVWQLKTVMTYYTTGEALGELLASLGISWLSFKVANYQYAYNQIGGNDAVFKAYIEGVKSKGISVGGWHWIGPDYPGLEGDRIEERRQKLGLDHLLIDAEYLFKRTYGMPKAAKAYCDRLHSPGGMWDVALCSYRFPEYHRAFPFAAFLNHENTNSNAPQVYWEQSHNPIEQLQRSIEQYDDIKYGVPFVPIGSTYGRGDWLPTVDDLKRFMDWCFVARVPAYGFYSLDWTLSHDKDDWLQVIGEVEEPPPPPPVDEIEVGDTVRVSANGYNLWTHNAPNSYTSTRNGQLPPDTALVVDETREVSGKLWVRSGQGWFAGWLVKEFKL